MLNTRLFKNRNFALYTFGSATTIIGDVFLSVALALYVLKLTGSASKFAYVMMISTIPKMLLGPVAGSLVDSFDRRKTLIFLDFIRGTALIVMFFISATMEIGLLEIYIIVLFDSVCQSFYIPATASVLPLILDENELVDGNLMERLVTEISNIAAPTMAAFIYGVRGIGIILLIDAVTFYASAFSEFLMRLKPIQKTDSEGNIVHNMVEGFRLYKDKEILSISLNGMLTHLLVLPFFVIGIPYLVKNVFLGSDLDFGMLESLHTGAALFTLITVPLVKKYFQELKALNSGMYGMLAAIAAMFCLSSPAFIKVLGTTHSLMMGYFGAIIFLFYLAFSTYGVFFSSFNQRKVPKQFLGRFYSMLIMLFSIGQFIGYRVYGFLFDNRVFLYPVLLASVGMILKLLLNRLVTPNAIAEDIIRENCAVACESE